MPSTKAQHITEQVADMIIEAAATGNHVNRIIEGYSVNLYRASKEFAIGCGMFHTQDPIEAANWLHSHSN